MLRYLLTGVLPVNSLRTFSVLALSALTLFAVACGGGDDASSSDDGSDEPAVSSSSGDSGSQGSSKQADAGSGIDACKLVTKADAASALGSEVKASDSVAKQSGAQSDCQYLSASADSPDNVYVQVASGKVEKDAFNVARDLYKDAKPLNGVGDSAFYVELGAPVVQVHILKGDRYLIIAVLDITPNDSVGAATALAKTAAGRL